MNFCPICLKFSHFREYGFKKRVNAQCPKCGSLERDRLTWLFLQNKTTFFSSPPSNMLHVGVERCLETKFREIIKEGYLSVDLKKDTVMQNLDITNIPFDDNTFNFICCIHVLEHIEDDFKALNELFRVLKGYAIITIPENNIFHEDFSIKEPYERLKYYGHPDHVRAYTASVFVQRLKQTAFKVNVFKKEDILKSNMIDLFGVRKSNGNIYYVRK